MRIEVAGMPGADAVSGAVALDVEVDPAAELELGLEPEEQAATASAAAATTAMAGARNPFDLFIEYLSFIGCRRNSPPGWLGVVAWRPADRRPEPGRRGCRPGARRGRGTVRTDRAATAPRPGCPAGTGASRR